MHGRGSRLASTCMFHVMFLVLKND